MKILIGAHLITGDTVWSIVDEVDETELGQVGEMLDRMMAATGGSSLVLDIRGGKAFIPRQTVTYLEMITEFPPPEETEE